MKEIPFKEYMKYDPVASAILNQKSGNPSTRREWANRFNKKAEIIRIIISTVNHEG